LHSEFHQVWDTVDRQQAVSLAEFMDFYKDVSPCVTKDEYFENMVRNTWNC